MKKVLISSVLCVLLLLSAMSVSAAQKVQPELYDVSFKNAQIEGKFTSENHEYNLILDDTNLTPTLEKCKFKGDAKAFVSYNYDDAKQPLGIVVTLQFDGGTSIYNFNYKNIKISKSSNNYLKSLDCELSEVYPQLNKDDTKYKLYVPNDLTVIKLTAVTEDVNAYCELPGEITVGVDQNPSISAIVTAADGSKRLYSFDVVRLSKNCKEVEAELEKPDFKSLVDGELFYQKPSFIISVCAAAFVLIGAVLALRITKRLSAKTDDADEKPFYDET